MRGLARAVRVRNLGGTLYLECCEKMGVGNTLPGLQIVSRSHTLRGVAPRDRLQVLLWLQLQALKQVRARTNSNKEQGAV